MRSGQLDYPSSIDALAMLGLGLAEGCVQTTHHPPDVFAHAGRLRDNIRFIHKSDVTLVGVLFEPSLLSPDFMQYRRAFLGFPGARTVAILLSGRLAFVVLA